MNKNILIVLMLMLSIVSVQGTFFITPYNESQNYNSFLDDTGNFQTDLLYESIWEAYLSGNISTDAYNDLTQVGWGGTSTDLFVPGEGEEQFTQFYGELSRSELEVLRNILIDTGYKEAGTTTAIDEQIALTSDVENKTYAKYLEYEALKNLQRENIKSLWVHIMSFTQLTIEMLNIGIYLIGFFLFVFVVVDAVPLALVYMRDKILENYLKKRGFKK